MVISGASGRLGGIVADLLLDRVDPPELILVTRTPDTLAAAARRGARVRGGDFTDPDGLVEAFRGGERLLLISTEPISTLSQHRNAIEAAKTAGVTFVAYTSFTEGSPADIAAEHRETERMLRESGLEWTVLRNSCYAETLVDDARAALAGGTLVHNAGDGRIAYVSREDCAAVAAAVVSGGDHAGRSYDVTGPEALGAADLAALYGELGGREVVPVAVDDGNLVERFETVSNAVTEVTGRPPRTLRQVLESHRDQLVSGGVSRRAVIGGIATLGAAVITSQVGVPRASAAPRADREVALITGTSSGFGRLTALSLARDGYEVFATMRHVHHRNAASADELRRTARREGLTLEVVEIDVRDERSVESGVRRALRRAGHIDVLVNNAGIFYPALLETMTVEQVQEVFETDVFGQLRMNRAVLPAMRDRRDGLIVQLTSGVGRIAFPFQGAYNGAKWAMEAMAEVSRYELSSSGVDVVIVEPGAYPTDLIDNARVLYRDYLRRLSRSDARRRAEYGELASRVENELQEPSDPDPREVADAVVRLARMPAGQRPLRTLLGADTEMLTEVNAVHQRIQHEIMNLAGYGDLISVQPSNR